MFDAIIQSQKINLVLETLNVVVEECKLNISEQGFSTSAVDQAGVCVVEIFVSDDAFEQFEASERKIGIDIEELNEILSIAENEPVSFTLQAEHLEGIFDDVDYYSALIDLDAIDNTQDIPDLELDAEFSLSSHQFDKAITVSNKVADCVGIVLDDERRSVQFNASGDVNRVIVEYEDDDLITLNGSQAKATFSIAYLEIINSVIPEDTNIQIQFDSDFPMVISYEILEGEGEVSFMLAPRIDE